MINIEDYKSYMEQNFNFIELLRENSSLVYDRLSDLFKVLGFVEMLFDQNEKIEEELDVIFEVGFSYLHEQLEEIKIYYNTYFKRNYPLFHDYEVIINYSLYLSDLEEVLKEKKIRDKEINKAFEEIKEDIESLLVNKKVPSLDHLNKYNEIIEQYVPTGTLTTLEIYAMIVEELQL